MGLSEGRTARRLAVVLLALGLAACTDRPDLGGWPCATDEACGAGRECQEGRCELATSEPDTTTADTSPPRNACRIEVDDDGDGSVDSWVTNVYDEAGLLVSSETDRDANGAADERRTYSYLAGDGRFEATESLDADLDGTMDQTTKVTTFLDDAGRVTREETDVGGDGSVELRRTFAYDESGRLTVVEDDLGADGSIDGRMTVSRYRPDGQAVTIEIDENADGILDVRLTYTYDEAGFVVMETFDRGRDDTIDARNTIHYDC